MYSYIYIRSYKQLSATWLLSRGYYIQTEDEISLEGELILRRAENYILINKDSKGVCNTLLKEGVARVVERSDYSIVYVGGDCMRLEPTEAVVKTKWCKKDKFYIRQNYKVLPSEMKNIFLTSNVWTARKQKQLGNICVNHYEYGPKKDLHVIVLLPKLKLILTSNREHIKEEGYEIKYIEDRHIITTKVLLKVIAEYYKTLEGEWRKKRLIKSMNLTSDDLLTFMEYVANIEKGSTSP